MCSTRHSHFVSDSRRSSSGAWHQRNTRKKKTGQRRERVVPSLKYLSLVDYFDVVFKFLICRNKIVQINEKQRTNIS